jgi:hypothetical protein
MERKMKTHIFVLASLIIIGGCNRDSVNDPLIEGNRLTASYNLDNVESLAEQYSEGLRLMSIGSEDVDYNGYANKWYFRFSSAGIAVDYYFHTTAKEVKYDSTSTRLIGSGFISNKWFDSDEALKIAEKNGGKDFRNKNSQYIIEASLGEPVAPNPITIWYITYRSKTDDAKSLSLAIDANSGEIVSTYPGGLTHEI